MVELIQMWCCQLASGVLFSEECDSKLPSQRSEEMYLPSDKYSKSPTTRLNVVVINETPIIIQSIFTICWYRLRSHDHTLTTGPLKLVPYY